MINRFFNRKVFINESISNSDILKERDKKTISQLDTAIFKYPTEEQIKFIPYYEHVWSSGDRLYKLSKQYFGSVHDWWIILNFNKLGSEMQIKNGDIVKIPVRVEDFLGLVL